MKINQMKSVQVEAKVLSISAKCSDCLCATLKDQDGKTIHDHDGYVPNFFPGRGGDYVNLDIEIDTGKILNWTPPTAKQIEEFINQEE